MTDEKTYTQEQLSEYFELSKGLEVSAKARSAIGELLEHLPNESRLWILNAGLDEIDSVQSDILKKWTDNQVSIVFLRSGGEWAA